jgi:hypothetical protein
MATASSVVQASSLFLAVWSALLTPLRPTLISAAISVRV